MTDLPRYRRSGGSLPDERARPIQIGSPTIRKATPYSRAVTQRAARPVETYRSPPSRQEASPGSSRPEPLMYAIGAVMLTYVWRIQDLFPILGAVKLPILAAGAALGLFFLGGAKATRSELLGKSRILRLLAGLTMAMMLSVPFGLYQGRSASFLLRDFGPNLILLVALMAASVRSERDIAWYARIHLLGAVLFCLVVHFRFHVGSSGRLGDLVYYDSNDLALLLVCSLPIALYVMLRSPRTWRRWAAAACLPLFIYTLVETGSRGGFLGLCAVGLYVLLRYGTIPWRRRLAAVAIGAILLIAVGSSSYWSMMGTILHPKQDYNWSGNAESGRMEIWKRGVGYMMSHPLFGVGVRNFPVAEGTLSKEGRLNAMGGGGFKWSAAHNSFVEIGAEVGIPGLVLFLLLLGAAFHVTARPPPEAPTLQDPALRQMFRTCLLGYVVSGFFLSAAYTPYLYSLLGMLCGLDKLDRRRLRAQSAGGARRAPARPRPAASR